ncbi:putative multiple-sugar transport system permease YteP [Clostridium oryzae]|uniref:Putative multiple-sugar transport system permease YteP n=2 Tax=Clostridium oryzae TaxID=1450648 RepID=A0A1V4IBJ5_9CLOT|nr:putative multiple-sugar transport system permease YteP [Clostridium oryzae]
MGIDQQLYEAAQIDGANKWKQLIHVTIPGIMPMIIIMFILAMGGLLKFNFGYSTAVGLFNSVVNFILIFATNKISQKVNETSLW